jgi:hypothetical protein
LIRIFFVGFKVLKCHVSCSMEDLVDKIIDEILLIFGSAQC